MENKKQKKRRSLLDAAYALFMRDGFQNTSIDDIVKQANVAKGTFYLYFRDKFDIMNSLALNISCKVLSDAYQHMMKNHRDSFAENIITVADYIIGYFTHNKLVLKLVEKNFSWPLVHEQVTEEQNSQLNLLLDEFCKADVMSGRGRDEVFKMLFLITEACGSVCYNSIIYEQPDTIENMKPFLYNAIRKLLA